MIDLHIHTKHSDGSDSPIEILKKANELKLEALSITDHNNVDSYLDFESINVKELYKNRIVIGCEFTTSYNGRLIEILGYNFDYIKTHEYLKKYYNLESINTYANTIYNRFIAKLNELNFTCSLPYVNNKQFNTEFVEKKIYEELISHKENVDRLDKELISSYNIFLRKGLTNPNSIFYINHASLKPPLEEILNLIHSNGGIAFLAHPYQYGFEDIEATLTSLYTQYKIDGIECYHTTFNQTQTDYLLNFANKNNLLISGGSDYHGTNKLNHNLGIGNNNLNINKSILNNWETLKNN